METNDSTCNGLENMDVEDEGFSLLEKPKNDGTQIADPSDLKFTEVRVSPENLKKAKTIKDYLDTTENPSVEKLREFAISDGGLIDDNLRKTGWPGLLGITPDSIEPAPSETDLRSHPEFGQVVLDVNRSIKRFPPGIPYDQRVALQEQLTNLILRVITKYPHLRYYQGYHDVAITILLVVGEDMAFRIMEKLSTEHLRDCMEPTMEKTSYLLNYIFPLINHLSPELHRHIDRSRAGTMFCLPWFLTWFGHSLNHYKDVVRLYDFFLASPPLMPLYLTAVIVFHRKAEVLEADCNMASIHCLLSQLPDELPFEDLIIQAMKLYSKLPPHVAEAGVKERIKKEKKLQDAEDAARKAVIRRNQFRGLRRQIERFVPNGRAQLFILAVSFAMGLYAYLKANTDYPIR
ncbi:hypothetical protein GE061_009742 [Apolygus lucorum]|uniref:Uncharacterized protein n=1 Tax=Apolygus lucorum TaxID=248454 RepID=A0A6A4KHN3_APOLU|nr:hypothetical protein GE061_009742 [Apolygus lucorum]